MPTTNPAMRPSTSVKRKAHHIADISGAGTDVDKPSTFGVLLVGGPMDGSGEMGEDEGRGLGEVAVVVEDLGGRLLSVVLGVGLTVGLPITPAGG